MTKDEIINAFHPDFMKTYYPDFTKEFRTIEANQIERDAAKKKRSPKRVRVKMPREPRRTVAEVRVDLKAKKEALLAPKEFLTYSKAGAGNVRKKSDQNDIRSKREQSKTMDEVRAELDARRAARLNPKGK
jgi:hypothetical protein